MARRDEPRHASELENARCHDGLQHWAGAAPGEGMAEQEEKGPLEKPIDWLSGWKASFERIRQLRQTGADVLLWGSVISLSGKSASAMRLFWTPTRDVSGAKSTGKYQTETIELPPVFWGDLKQILGLLVQSRIATLTF